MHFGGFGNLFIMKKVFLKLWHVFGSLSLGLLALQSQAQVRVEVSGVGMTQIPIAIQPLRGEEAAPQKIAAIVQADLERSGQFRALRVGAGHDENERPDLSVLKQAGADALLAGSVQKLADGRFEVRIRVWDAVKGQDLGAQAYTVVAADLRMAAHRAADFVYEKITGERGVFSTRIAYVTKNKSNFQLWVADADGENAQPALTSAEPIISPSWSPNGQQLAYVSFEGRKPRVYVHEVATGKRRLLADFRGSNSAPAWSPDGRQLIVTLSRDGGSQLFAIPAQGGEPRRLVQSSAIDTEPVFTPDGASVFFVSDRGVAPQIYRTPAQGGPVNRVSTQGGYNISPAISPDGRLMAYISRVGGGYRLHLMDLASGQVNALGDTAHDERPSFAPNGKLIIYATQLNGRESLMVTTLDGRVRTRLAGVPGDIREPQWSPYHRAP